MALHCVMSCCY